MVNYVDINGNRVIDLTPDYNRPLALVDLDVLNKLTLLLPKADFGTIRHDLRERIMKTQDLQEIVEACQDFISFHRSVNLIREICQGELTEVDQETTDLGLI